MHLQRPAPRSHVSATTNPWTHLSARLTDGPVAGFTSAVATTLGTTLACWLANRRSARGVVVNAVIRFLRLRQRRFGTRHHSWGLCPYPWPAPHLRAGLATLDARRRTLPGY